MNNYHRTTTEIEMRAIGKRLLVLRARLGVMNARTFALKHGLHPTRYKRLENGTGNPTLKTLATICLKHNMTLIEVFHASNRLAIWLKTFHY